MNHLRSLFFGHACAVPRLLTAWVFSGAMLGISGTAVAATADAVMTIESDPTVTSVSRVGSFGVMPAHYDVAYRVSIYNPSNSSKNFRFIGDVAVVDGNGAVPTSFVSSRSDCTLTSANPVRVTCPKLEVEKRTTITFNLQFRTPTAGTAMGMQGSLFFPTSSTSVTVSASAMTSLVKLTEPEYTVGFDTFVGTAGGVYWTGNAQFPPESTNRGGVATSQDAITTTLVVPPIGFTTRASVLESSNPHCGPQFSATNGCYQSRLQVPGAFNALTIYLRFDRTIVNAPAAQIASTSIYYQKDPTEAEPNPSVIPLLDCQPPSYQPASGVPCILKRTPFDTTNMPTQEWFGDWQFEIRALDNGRYFN